MVNISEYLENLRHEIKALLFDWGNTVMKVFPDQTGPMALWPKVVAVEGIQEILPLVKERFKIVLISNAQHSDRDLIYQALERVSLSQYFHEIFTPHELNERKPAPQFYLNILNQIEIEPENGIMIGDDYENDIIAAKQVGLWTIWYNEDNKQHLDTNFPYHDAEINKIEELASLIHKEMSFKLN